MVIGAIVNIAESQLINEALSGSEKAFEELINLHMDNVYGVALRIVRNPSVAEDITQEVFVIVFKKLRSFRKDSAFSTWLYRITVNHALRRLKKEQRYVSNEDNENLNSQTDQTLNPEDQLLKEEENRLIREFINELPDKQRTVMALRLEKDIPFKEIARILGRSVGGVKSNYFHAVQKLKAAWDNRSKHEEV
jgi:RNA polymerase sigma-70 factor, ECF subfamily